MVKKQNPARQMSGGDEEVNWGKSVWQTPKQQSKS